MQLNESLIRDVVAQVLAEVKRNGAPVAGKSSAGRYGIFTCVNEAVAAAREAFEQLQERTDRRPQADHRHIRRISIEQCVELGTMEMEETKIGGSSTRSRSSRRWASGRRASSSCGARFTAATTAWR
jgi:aldehyde dehydrogenase